MSRRASPPTSIASPQQRLYDQLCREIHADLLASAICPLCGGPLVARCDRHGPYFHCYCPRKSANPVELPQEQELPAVILPFPVMETAVVHQG